MDDFLKIHIEHLSQYDFTVVATIFEHYIEFVIYDIEGWDTDNNGNNITPLWHKKNAPCSPDPVETLDEADIYLHGSVKWDGCSNWNFDENTRAYLHGCCRQDIQRFGDVMGWCWDFTSKNCLMWDGD